MVRWSDGLYGGLVAGLTSAAFYAAVAVAWMREMSLAAFFSQPAQALAPFHAAPPSAQLAWFGFSLYLLAAAFLGICFAVTAGGLASTQRAPTSVLWGIGYGLAVWALLNDVVVPVSGVVNVQPLWEGIAGTVVCYGIVLSESLTVLRRRAAPSAFA